MGFVERCWGGFASHPKKDSLSNFCATLQPMQAYSVVARKYPRNPVKPSGARLGSTCAVLNPIHNSIHFSRISPAPTSVCVTMLWIGPFGELGFSQKAKVGGALRGLGGWFAKLTEPRKRSAIPRSESPLGINPARAAGAKHLERGGLFWWLTSRSFCVSGSACSGSYKHQVVRTPSLPSR